jgi:hypothetical protein
MSVTAFANTQLGWLLRHNKAKVSEVIVYQKACNLLQVQHESFWFVRLNSGTWR